MIEKLQTWQRPLSNNPMAVENMGMDNESLFNKINELVDAINGILDYAPLEMAMKAEPADPYTEQKKWIGKACWFWDGNAQTKAFGQLNQIDPLDDGQNAPYQTNYGQWYEHCEPANDDIIYKGA